MAKGKTEKPAGRRRSFKVSLLAIALIPMLLVGIIISVVSVFRQKSSLTESYIARLKAVDNMLYEEYKTSADGVSSLTYDEATNTVTMNDEVIAGAESTKMEQSFDTFRKNLDIDCTLFVGDTRRVTSVPGDDANGKATGTQAAPEVVEAVINQGQEYSSANT